MVNRQRIIAAVIFAFSTLTPSLLLADDQQHRAQVARDAAKEFEKRNIIIWSDGTRMAGDLYLPADLEPGEKRPAVVFCAGTGGTKKGTGGRLGPIFAARGYVALAFDYRGWGESESQLMALDPQPKPDANGEMTIKVRALRWQMNYTDQTEDIRAAISFLAGEPSVNAERIGIMGSSYGGGLVTWVAGNDPRVKCMVAQVPGMGGTRTPAADQRLYQLHSQQARGETEPVPFETGKLGGKLAQYAQMRSNPAKSIGFNAVDAAEKIHIPAMFVVAENEELSNNQVVLTVHEKIKARGVPTEYIVIKVITHYGIYREGADEATRLELAWFDKHLKDQSENKTQPDAQPAQPAPPPRNIPPPAPNGAALRAYPQTLHSGGEPTKEPSPADQSGFKPTGEAATIRHFEKRIRPEFMAKGDAGRDVRLTDVIEKVHRGTLG